MFEAQNDFDKASADLRRATELRPRNVFEAASQNAARQKLQQLAKRIPGSGDRRQVRIRATPRGVRLLQDGRRRRIEYLASHLGELTKQELTTLEDAVDVLERILGEWPGEG